MVESEIRSLKPSDLSWFLRVWGECPELGDASATGSSTFYRCLVKVDGSRIVGIEEKALMHYHKRKDGFLTLHNIGVSVSYRRQGLAGKLLDYLRSYRLPIRLKTDEDNTASRRFYERHGFLLQGHLTNRAGKAMVSYVLFPRT